MSLAPATSSATAATRNSDSAAAVSFHVKVATRTADYVEMSRPRIAVMTMVAVAVGFVLASPIVVQWSTLIWSLAGIVLLVASSSIFNQALERQSDSRMNRTADRPVASGRVSTREAVLLGSACGTVGFVVLWQYSTPSAAWATLATLVVYVFGYTLLKPHTSLCTTVGAIPGAMPPVLGWLASGGDPGVQALALFALFFVWQFPHFLAIGWIHRHDYLRAKLRMLPSFRDDGLLTAVLAVVYAVAFVPVSMLPGCVGLASSVYVGTAFVLSLCYLVCAVRFLLQRSVERARRLLMVSLLVLPLLLAALVGEFVFLTAFRY